MISVLVHVGRTERAACGVHPWLSNEKYDASACSQPPLHTFFVLSSAFVMFIGSTKVPEQAAEFSAHLLQKLHRYAKMSIQKEQPPTRVDRLYQVESPPVKPSKVFKGGFSMPVSGTLENATYDY